MSANTTGRNITGGNVSENVTPGAALQVPTQITLTANTPTAVGASGGPYATQGVSVQASLQNSGTVYVGWSDVSATKCLAELQAGALVNIPVDDPSTIFAFATASNQKVNVGWV